MSVQLNDEAIEKLFRDKEGPIGKIMERAGYAVESAAKSLLLIPGSGGMYGGVLTFRRGDKIFSNYSTGGSAPHRASAPGEPPSSDTGALLNSISHKVDVEQTVFVRIGSDKKYAIWLELGTRYMAPRPFLRPALDIGLAQMA